MIAQLANGGYKINPKIIVNEDDESLEEIKDMMKKNFEKYKNTKKEKSSLIEAKDQMINFINDKKHEPLYRNPENVKFILNSMFAATNEVRGTSYASRIEDPKYQFAGKTGTSQVKRITKKERELDLKTIDIPYNDRDHALYVAFGPYKNPRYALSIVVEHGGSGSSTAAPIAKKLFKLIIDRHDHREKIRNQKLLKI